MELLSAWNRTIGAVVFIAASFIFSGRLFYCQFLTCCAAVGISKCVNSFKMCGRVSTSFWLTFTRKREEGRKCLSKRPARRGGSVISQRESESERNERRESFSTLMSHCNARFPFLTCCRFVSFKRIFTIILFQSMTKVRVKKCGYKGIEDGADIIVAEIDTTKNPCKFSLLNKSKVHNI